MRLLVTAVLGVPCLLGTSRADSLDDLLGPREIAVGEAMRGGATGSSAVAMNPAGLPLTRELVFEGGYGYRASDSASLIGVSACDSTTAAPGCFYYEYAGSSPEVAGMSGRRRTHLGAMTLSRAVLPRVLVGAGAKYFDFNTDMAGETDASGFAFDFGATLRLAPQVSFGLSGQNLVTTEDSPQFPRAVGGGLIARPVPTLAFGFDSRWRLDGDVKGARFGGGGELFLRSSGGQNGIPIRLGGLRDTGLAATFVTAGLGYANVRWGLDVSGRRQVAGGDDTLVLASLRFYGPREPSPSIE
jgi:hypothetical protein